MGAFAVHYAISGLLDRNTGSPLTTWRETGCRSYRNPVPAKGGWASRIDCNADKPKSVVSGLSPARGY